jgi:hypothetical protein
MAHIVNLFRKAKIFVVNWSVKVHVSNGFLLQCAFVTQSETLIARVTRFIEHYVLLLRFVSQQLLEENYLSH